MRSRSALIYNHSELCLLLKTYFKYSTNKQAVKGNAMEIIIFNVLQYLKENGGGEEHQIPTTLKRTRNGTGP